MEEAYKRLWAAVLDQAIKEVLGRNGERLREKARVWLQSDNQDIGSFLWICDILKLDPQSIHRFLTSPTERSYNIEANIREKLKVTLPTRKYFT